jgi:Rrf2 family iron-sulfur cluster assembly transcriptional regulator
MKINTKLRYGLRTMVEIAGSTDQIGVLQKDISSNQKISIKYLDAIISSLKVKGLIANTRGKGSGYRLSRPADQITMLDIYTAFEQVVVVECLSNEGFCDRAKSNCSSRSYWDELKTDFESMLRNKTLAQVMAETKNECKTHTRIPK